MGEDTVPSVRENEESEMGAAARPMIRAKVRLDFWLVEQTIDWSIVAWEQPVASLVRNDINSHIGFMCSDIALQEVGEQLALLFDQALNWTPPADVAPRKDGPRRR